MSITALSPLSITIKPFKNKKQKCPTLKQVRFLFNFLSFSLFLLSFFFFFFYIQNYLIKLQSGREITAKITYIPFTVILRHGGGGEMAVDTRAHHNEKRTED